jgi:serpin B
MMVSASWWFRTLAFLAIGGLLAAACGAETTVTGPSASVEVERAAVGIEQAGVGADALHQFGWDLYRELAEPGANFAFSPHSVGVALAMTRAGAAGETRQAMDAALHVVSGDDLGASLNALDASLAAAGGTREQADGTSVDLAVDVANALWAQDGFDFEEPFLTSLATDFGAGVRLVDYQGDAEGARQEINGWIAGETRDRIPELIAPGVVSGSTRLVLTNAVYLNAPWLRPFEEGATAPADFHRLDGTTSTVDMMSMSAPLSQARVGSVQAVELPYVGDELAMLVLVPDEGTFETVSASIGAGMVDEIVAALAPSEVVLGLPTFELTTTIGLAPALKSLGLGIAFDPDQADFSAMSAEADPFISDVVHEAFLSVDEAGTEAAAATAVVVDLKAAPQDPVSVVVDRPFLVVIRHVETGGVLFLAQIVDPSS